MKTYLFIWNPKNFYWESLEQDIKDVNLREKSSQRWSCGNTKSIKPGDRIFLFKLGTQPKGIIGSGYATTEPFIEEHWNDNKKSALYIDIDFEILLNPNKEKILSLEILQSSNNLSKQNWTPQSSGISIRNEIVDELETLWFNFLTSENKNNNPFIPSENEIQRTYTEGSPNQIIVTKYERNPHARKVCILHYGLSCIVCGFNFEKTYGQIGKDYIHVHHLNQISNIGEKHEINPLEDLVPVCPNCHSIIHKRKIPITIEEMKEIIKNRI